MVVISPSRSSGSFLSNVHEAHDVHGSIRELERTSMRTDACQADPLSPRSARPSSVSLHFPNTLFVVYNAKYSPTVNLRENNGVQLFVR